MQLRVYTLYRVSTIGQVERDDIPMQKNCCRAFAEQQGWVILREFSEKGVSGYKKSVKDRDQLQKIKQAALDHQFDILLVYMFDRLGRKDDETPFVVEWFVKRGIQVWSVMEGQQRFDSHVDKLMNYIRYWQASGESEKTSIRTKTRLGQLTEEGFYTGGSISYGYRRVDSGRKNKKNQTVFDLEVNEEEAEVVRLIFHKYVNEGYGALRISNYLHEQGITRADGRNFPNTSINRMIKNRAYTGILINGEHEAECPELRIIDPELFDRAQEIRLKRTKPHNYEFPMNCKSKALLVGRIFCGHCGNRLTLTTGGKKIIRADGSYYYKTRIRYQCHYNIRHPGVCDGQSGYGMKTVDSIVDRAICAKFAQIKAASKPDLLQKQQKKEIARCKAKIERLKTACEKKQKEIQDFRAETIKVIRGESKLSADLLNSLITEGEAALKQTEKDLMQAQQELDEVQRSCKALNKEYEQIMTWADLYNYCSFEAKKMIVLQFVKSVHVRRGFEIDIQFQISFEEFQNFQSQPENQGEQILEEEDAIEAI